MIKLILVVLFVSVKSIAVTCTEYEKDGHPYTTKEWKSNNSKCTNWNPVKDSVCSFEGKEAGEWERDCQKASVCAADYVCLDQNPSKLKVVCTSWFKDEGATCLSKAGSWEQHWARTCTDKRFESDFCSDLAPQ